MDQPLSQKSQIRTQNEGHHSLAHMIVEEVTASLSLWNRCNNTIAANFRGSEERVVMQRFVKEKEEVRGMQRDIIFPSQFSEYNKSMHGTDIMDQTLNTYRISVDRKKYYMKIFHWLLQVSVVNAWILHRKAKKDHGGQHRII